MLITFGVDSLAILRNNENLRMKATIDDLRGLYQKTALSEMTIMMDGIHNPVIMYLYLSYVCNKNNL